MDEMTSLENYVPPTPEEMEKIKADREERERQGLASHSIAQAAHILGLFATVDIFRRGAGTKFASEISKLAISTITENGKVFNE